PSTTAFGIASRNWMPAAAAGTTPFSTTSSGKPPRFAGNSAARDQRRSSTGRDARPSSKRGFMSAFICNHSHVTALAVHAARSRILGLSDAHHIGELLHAENVKSVNYRYGEATKPDFAICPWAAFHAFSQVQIIKAARCLEYQSCEHPG